MKQLLQIDALVCGYAAREVVRVNALAAKEGELIALVGRNGTGKSTFLKTIAGVIAPLSGQILLHGVNTAQWSVRERAQHITAVWSQRHNLPSLSVKTLAAMGRYASGTSWNGQLSDNDAALVNEALRNTGLTDLQHRNISELSDGELQKALIARALVQQTPVLLLDEPTAFLDYVAKEELFVLLQSLVQLKKMCIVFSSHDMELVEKFAHRQWLVQNGTMDVLR